MKQPRAVFCGPRAADGAAAQQDAPGSSARGAGDSYGGPGAGRDPESHPRRISGPLAAAVDAGTRQPAVPLEAGRRQGESRVASGPEHGPKSRGPGRRTRGPRRRHSGSSAGLRTSDRTGSAPREETAPTPRTRPPTGPRLPRPLASSGPTWGLGRSRGNLRAEDRENRCAACPPARWRGLGLRRAARASPAEDPSRKLRGWGSPREGAGGVPGAPGSAAVLRFSCAS